jgi:hypothetical protein
LLIGILKFPQGLEKDRDHPGFVSKQQTKTLW